MEAIQNKRGIGTVVRNSSDVGCAHVAARPLYLLLLIIAEHLLEENINGFATFTWSDPHDTAAIQIVDQRGVLVSFGIGDFINADPLQAPDFVALTGGRNAPVEQVGERGGWGMQQCAGILLRHHLTVA